MRASVVAAWPAFCSAWEGRCNFLYLDTKSLPTTGLGYRVVDLSAMLGLPWLTPENRSATPAQKTTEWQRINSRTDLAPRGGFAFKAIAVLHLPDVEIDRQLLRKTAEMWDQLTATLPDLETWPADAQLALMDMSWNLGPNFLGVKWPNFTREAKAGNFTGCAEYCLRAVKAPRDYRWRSLYSNAAKVKTLALDPNVLWDTTPPVAPPKPPVVIKPEPPEVFPMAANVSFRGRRTCSCAATSLPYVELDMLMRGQIKSEIDIFQMIGNAAASKGTHDRGGCVDTGQYNTAQIDTWRRWGWTMQRRDIRDVKTHAHGWPYGCPHLAPLAVGQENDWKRGDSGLVGSAGIAGRYPIRKWDDALRRNKVALLDDIRKAVKLGVLDALDTDGVINNVGNAGALTGNPDNPTISVKTALESGFNRTMATELNVRDIKAAIAALPRT